MHICYRYIPLAILALVLPFSCAFADSNAGFVDGLWYSTSPERIFAGEPVRIYVAVRNNTGSDLTGTVSFFDGTKKIGDQNVQAIDGHIIETWADWDPTYGTHTLSANLARVTLDPIGSSTERTSVTSDLAKETLFVDRDTDRDGIGDRIDTDDDNDGVPDVAEKLAGTNPLVANSPAKAQANETRSEDPVTTSVAKQNTATSSVSGLEQFLAPSPAKDMLTSVTDVLTSAKQNLDTYREERAAAQYDAANAGIDFETNAQGFGTVTRSKAADPNKAQLPKVELHGTTFFAKTLDAMKQTGGGAYGFVLAILSFMLGHPMIIEFALLVFILFMLIQTAARLGRRQRPFKR